MRTVIRGVLAAVGASTALVCLSACATNRAALHPLSEADLRAAAPSYAPAPPSSPAPARAPYTYGSTSAPLADPGPMSAQALAQRTGLSYQDGGSYVLLSNASSRIRLYPDTRLLSIDGSEVEIRGRIVRQGPSVIVPGPAVALVESHLYRAREQHRMALAAQEGISQAAMSQAVGGARVPAKSAPRAAPARTAAPPRPAARAVSGADPSWAPAGTPERPWRWIVLHHSDDRSGNAAKYHAQHLAQGWENGLGYHFVIGNGTQSGDGEVEVGGRWVRQIQGAHAKTDTNCFNEQGVGICLVGDFENHGRPSSAQMDALVRLCLWLMDRYDIPPASVMGHCDCKPTACPGKNFPWAELRARLAAGR